MKNLKKKIIKEIIEKSSPIIILGTNAHLAAISVAAIRVVGGLAAIFLMKGVPRSKIFFDKKSLKIINISR